jgi:purine-nucleoside phosphorylase
MSPLMLQFVSGQSYTTTTTEATSFQVMTYTAGSTLTTHPLQPQVVINRAVTINATTGTSMSCETISLTFNGTQGEYLTGNITSDIPVGFYLMQDSSYKNWLKTGSCGAFPAAINAQPLNVTSYAFNVALPFSGPVDVVLVNYSNNRNADVFLTAALASQMVTATQQLVATITSTIFSQSEIVEQQMSTSTMNYSTNVIVAIVLGAIILMAVAAVALRRRRSQAKADVKAET